MRREDRAFSKENVARVSSASKRHHRGLMAPDLGLVGLSNVSSNECSKCGKRLFNPVPIASVIIILGSLWGIGAMVESTTTSSTPKAKVVKTKANQNDVKTSSPPVVETGKWRVSKQASLIDDSANVYLSLLADSDVRSGYKTTRPSLNIRCKENKTEVFVSWDLYLGIDKIAMLTRLDKDPATRQWWVISTDYKAAFAPNNDIAFTKQLMAYKRLLAQVTPYGESPVMVTFDLTGLTKAIEPLQSACHWE